MPISHYGVLKGKVTDSMKGNEDSPHYQVLVEDHQGTKYRIAINIKSQSYPSEVLYFVSDDFNSGNITLLPGIPSGFTEINDNRSGLALDYIRGNLFDPKKMIPLPADTPGPDNDLNDKINYYIEKAKNEKAVIYAYGDKWGPEPDKPDQYFNFLPGNGIHDIHMNQGNVGKWEKDNGTWQDGGVLIYFEESQKWVGIFLAFQSQSWCTDDQGNATRPVTECNYLNAGKSKK